MHDQAIKVLLGIIYAYEQKVDDLDRDLARVMDERQLALAALDSTEASLVAVLGELVRVREKLAETELKVTLNSLGLVA